MKRKTIFIAVIVIVLITGGFVIWKLNTANAPRAPVGGDRHGSATTVMNARWHIYKDNASGLSFEYPPALAVDKQDNNGYSIIHVTDPKNHAVYVAIIIVSDPSQPDINKIFTGPYPKEIPPTSNDSMMTVDQKTLNGLQGVEVYGYTQEGSSYSDVFMYKSNHLWKIYLDPVLEGRVVKYPGFGMPTPNKDTYKQILASIEIYP